MTRTDYKVTCLYHVLGQDTTSSTIGWAIYSLAKYPDIQQKVYEDVRRVIEDKQTVHMLEALKTFQFIYMF